MICQMAFRVQIDAGGGSQEFAMGTIGMSCRRPSAGALSASRISPNSFRRNVAMRDAL
jgi:hypothetical protein